jgi:hypothetical protein
MERTAHSALSALSLQERVLRESIASGLPLGGILKCKLLEIYALTKPTVELSGQAIYLRAREFMQ